MRQSIASLAFTVVTASLLSVSTPAQVILAGMPTSGLARSMNNNSNSFAFTPDGAMWAVVYETDASGSGGHLELRRSATHGVTWFGSYPLPNNTSHNNHHNNSGCIVAGRDADKLHVAWADKTAAPGFWSAMYQVFDTKTLSWIGTPTLLAQGFHANNQFWPVDITMTPKGTVVVCVSGHRAGGLGLGSWDCGLAVQPRGGSFNATLLNLRQGGDPYSQNASIVAVDEVIHCCMKNNRGGYGICYRSYDTESANWDQTTQVFVGPGNNNAIAAGNKSVIAADTKGGLYVLYVTGNATASNTLRLAYAAPGTGSQNADWKDIHVIPHTPAVGTNYRSVSSTNGAYPLIQGGNTTYRNYTLAPGAGEEMAVVYSKAFETFTNLYVQSFVAGNVTLPELQISQVGSKPYSYEWVTGTRNGDFVYTPSVLTFGKTDATPPNNGTFPNGQVELYRLAGLSPARTIAFGTGCQGNLTTRPRIHARESLPTLNTTFRVTMDRFPASANFFLAIGTQLSLPTLNLAFMGAAECDLYHDFPLVVGLTASASGDTVVPWNVPNDPSLNGVTAFAQCLVVAPGSTPGSVVTTNSLSVILGN